MCWNAKIFYLELSANIQIVFLEEHIKSIIYEYEYLAYIHRSAFCKHYMNVCKYEKIVNSSIPGFLQDWLKLLLAEYSWLQNFQEK